MKAIFYLSIVFFILFELANVYFIMPMPGSQELDSIDLAYFLYSRRWFFRCLLGGVAALTLLRSHWKHLWIPACLLAAAAIVIYMANFRMAADHMFLQAGNLRLKTAADNQVGADRLILGSGRSRSEKNKRLSGVLA